MKKVNEKKKKKGFTLIELIVVIAILGILSAIAIPRLSGFQDSAKIKADIANAKSIANITATLLADGKITKPTTDDKKSINLITFADKTDENEIKKMMQNIPQIQFIPLIKEGENNYFVVEIDKEGTIVIKEKASSKELYPNTEAYK